MSTRSDPITIEPLDATLGAVVTDVRLASLGDDEWAAVERAFLDHAVLVFPAQHLSDDEQKAFGRRFGALETIGRTEGLTPIANVGRDGDLLAADHPAIGIMKGNEGWHTDSSYMPVSAKASMLSAHVVPSAGGQTEWADMRAAFDALPAELRPRIDGLAAHHSLIWSQREAGYGNPGPAFYGFHDGPEPLRPLVKVHPETGRPALYIGRHAHDIPGLPPDESRALLDELLAFACRPPRVYAHEWAVGDLVVWDNRCVLHRARPYDLAEPRVMKHTRICGDPVTEAALPAA